MTDERRVQITNDLAAIRPCLDERRAQITNDLAAIRPCLDERRVQITNDLAAIRSCLDEAEVLHDAGRTVGVNALLLMALRLVARLASARKASN